MGHRRCVFSPPVCHIFSGEHRPTWGRQENPRENLVVAPSAFTAISDQPLGPTKQNRLLLLVRTSRSSYRFQTDLTVFIVRFKQQHAFVLASRNCAEKINKSTERKCDNGCCVRRVVLALRIIYTCAFCVCCCSVLDDLSLCAI
jgi:hypothetical protein